MLARTASILPILPIASSIAGIAMMGLLACGSPSGEPDERDGPPPTVVGVEVRDVQIPADLHVQGLRVPGKLFVPTVAGPGEPLPAVLVLHGSGGLFAAPDVIDPARPCSPELEPQFTRWGERLAQLGYVVLMPASFDARGFCDWYGDAARRPDDFDDDRERLVGRLYDADAASRYLCDLDGVDCDRLGLLGFSNGASVLLLALHWQIDRALAGFAVGGGVDLDLPVDVLPPGRPEFQVGVAYYPGCGLEGIIRFGTGPDDAAEEMFFPSADLFIEHGDADTLVDDCSVDAGRGRRELQAAAVAESRGLADPYHVTVHPGAEHGFDNAGAPGTDEGSGSERAEDLRARDTALATALEQFAAHLGGARP